MHFNNVFTQKNFATIYNVMKHQEMNHETMNYRHRILFNLFSLIMVV